MNIPVPVRPPPRLVGEALFQLQHVGKAGRVVAHPGLERAQRPAPVAEAARIGHLARRTAADQRRAALEPARLHHGGVEVGQQLVGRDLGRLVAGPQPGRAAERRPVVEPRIDARRVDAGPGAERTDRERLRAGARGHGLRRRHQRLARVFRFRRGHERLRANKNAPQSGAFCGG